MASVTGGDRAMQTLQRLASNLGQAPNVRVGFLNGATYPDGTSVAMVAAMNEFGVPSRGQPPRPYFRDMISAHKDSWPDAAAQLLQANGMNAAQTLDQIGQGVVGQLQQSIRDFDRVPLAQATIDRKGFDKQLIDTATMLRSPSYEVVGV